MFSGTLTANFFYVNAANTSLTGAWVLAGSAINGNSIVIANGANTTGDLTVSHSNISSTQAANTVSYSLYVGGNSSSTGAVGALVVTASVVNLTPNGAAVGQTGTGTLTVTGGSSATFASSDSATIAALAVGRAGTGTVNVAGGSILVAKGYAFFGRQGTGALFVTGGSEFIVGSAGGTTAYGIAIGDGSPTLSSTGTPNSPLYFGGTGTARVIAGSILHSLADVLIGYRGSTGTLSMDGGSQVTADTTITVGGGTDRTGASGTVLVQGGSVLQATSAAINSAGMTIGSDVGTTGAVTVTGIGSKLTTSNYRLTIGSAGGGSLTIAGGATAASGSTGANYIDIEAALAVGAAAGGVGALTITGSGSTLSATGDAVLGGDEKNNGIYTVGGTATVLVTSGGKFAVSGRLTLDAGASLTVDQSSTLIAPTIAIVGGSADLYTLTAASSVSFAGAGVLKVHAVSGANTIATFGFGKTIDIVGTTAATLSGNTVTSAGGSITLNAPSANASYQLLDDGHGGQDVVLTPQTIGVYRFFDTKLGTHLYTSSLAEEQNIVATRPDLTLEGIGLQSVAVAASDPSAVAVYRFFSTTDGTHFFTASATERDQVIATRTDLTYEPTSSFYEHATAQAGDVAVYRFFNSTDGTHFYTDSATEKAGIQASLPNMVLEGIGFYEPHQNYATR